jgi:hypothetical protein
MVEIVQQRDGVQRGCTEITCTILQWHPPTTEAQPQQSSCNYNAVTGRTHSATMYASATTEVRFIGYEITRTPHAVDIYREAQYEIILSGTLTPPKRILWFSLIAYLTLNCRCKSPKLKLNLVIYIFPRTQHPQRGSYGFL